MKTKNETERKDLMEWIAVLMKLIELIINLVKGNKKSNQNTNSSTL